jgi:hypothetical protein
MFDASRRPKRRLFYWALAVLVAAAGLHRPASGATTSASDEDSVAEKSANASSTPAAAGATAKRGRAAAPPPSPTLTTVADSVYMADGTPASGTVIITWPAFVSGSGSSIAAGTTNVTLGANGALNVALTPNAGANPPGVYYTVVYQLQPGEVRTEYWMVPSSTSSVNLAAVRTTPGSGTAAQPASMQYVNTALAAKANDSAVVHLTGSETINGAKSFATAPNVPAPQNTGDVANKAYVDTAVANVGAGSYLSTAGGTMTGALTLNGAPTAPMQATSKQYVDTGIASKADLVSGVVPAGELGAGTANSGTCLYGNGTWGPCGSGSGNVSTTPSATQAIAEPAGAVFTANRMGQKRMADQFNWKLNPTTPASLTPGTVTVTLSPCPQGFLNGINGSNSNHWIYVDSAPGDAQQPGEPVLISAESCPAGAASGTISFTVGYAHGAGYALESGTGGIKEASVDANQVRYDTVRGNNTWIEVTPNTTTKIKAPLYWQTTMGRLQGSSLLECSVNMSCLNIGDTNSGGFAKGNVSQYTTNVVDGLWIRPDQTMVFWDVAPSSPAAITAGATSATLTIPTCPAGFWPLIPNQILWLNGTSGGLVSTAYEATAPGPGEFVQVTGGSCTPGAVNGTIKIVPATPGISAFYPHDAGYTLSNGATALIEDNSQGTIIQNIRTNGFAGTGGYGFVIQNDNNQAEEVRNVNMNGGVRCDVDFCGATLFGPGPNGINAGITHLYEGSGQTCAEWYDGNDLLIGPTVCQGFANFAIFMSTRRGGSLQRAAIHSVHRERGGVNNSLGQYLGAADMIVQGYNLAVDGNGDGMNGFPVFPVAGNPGGQLQIYYLSIVDVTDGTKTVPIPLGQASVNNPNTNNVTVKWVAADALAGKTINYELYRLAPGAGVPGQVPYAGVCDGVGGDGTCLVAGNINPATVCDIHGACVFTDSVATLTGVTPYNGADGSTAGGYFPTQSFSPGGIVLSGGASYQGDPGCLVVMSGPWLSGFASVVNNAPAPGNCIPSGGSFNTVLSSFMNNSGGYAQFGLLFPDRTKVLDGGNWTGLKGRLNFIGGGTYPRDVATWRDSNPAKTMSSKLEYGSGVAGTNFGTVNRPQWDASDIATGVENAGTGLYDRVPANGVFDWYVGALPNNAGGTSTNWTEELSGTGHTFKTPVTVNGNLTVTGTCIGCGGGSGAWSSLTAPTSNLNVNLGSYLTGLTVGDFGSTPSTGSFSVTDSATSAGDTSTNFLVNTGVGSRHSPFSTQIQGINQLQICWQPGPQGEAVIGSAVACGAISQSPFAKFVAMSATGAHSVERLYQQSSGSTGTMLEMNNATAAGSGFNFWKACAGASATDTSCGTGTNVASLRGDGYLTAAAGAFSGNLTVNGQLLVAGPWMVSSPIPAAAMAAAGSGTSALGISNDGNFYISANGGAPLKVATSATSSYFSNLWQEDANTLGEYNGTTAQGLHVYGTYTNASNYERTGLGWDATDNYFVLRNENAGTGQQHGIGFWIGSGIRWGIDTQSAFKPFQNNSFDIGVLTPSQLVPRTVYAATSFDTLTQGRLNFELCNDATTGTALNFLAKYNDANPACALKAGTSDTDGVIGVVSGGSGTSGNAVITYRGYVSCSFDGLTTTGDFVVASTTNAGDCHDAGATRPTGAQVLGRVESTNAGAGTYAMRVGLESPAGAVVASIFGRTGIVVAASGDYSVGQITGAAPIASPTFTGTVTAPTASVGDNSTKVATTAYVRNEAQFAWTCPVAGATTTGVSYCNWTVPANLTITQLDLAASTAPAGCTTYPTLQIWDGKANAEVGSYSISMTSGGNFYPVVTGSTNLAQGEYLRIKVTTGGAGCTTTPAGVVATVTYQMQN